MTVAPLRILSLSSRYPNAARPNLGNFVERQNVVLSSGPGVEVEVMAPIPLPPYPLSLRHPALRAVPREELRAGLRVHHPRFTAWPYLRGPRAQAMAQAVLPVLRAVRESFPFDLICAEFFWPEGPAAIALGRSLGVPVAIKARGIDFDGPAIGPRLRRQLLQAGRAGRLLLAVSADMKGRMVEAGLPAERIFVHYSGIDRELFRLRDRAEAKAALGVKGPLLLCVGNLVARKGQALAIKALTRIEGATLVLAGDGPDRGRLKALAAMLDVAERVRMLGSVPHALLPQLYAAADVTVHASAAEGLGNARVESLACGTPLVTTAVGGAAEILTGPDGGRIVAPDLDSVAAAIREMLAESPNPSAVRKLTERFGWERNAEELEAHLRKLAAG